jgi:hypothetical protein
VTLHRVKRDVELGGDLALGQAAREQSQHLEPSLRELPERVRDAFLAGRDTASAVTEGPTRTARVVTAAATIMIVVFGALALSPEVFLS